MYEARYQHLIFDANNRVLDYGIDVYNAADSSFNAITRYLSNQGCMAKHPYKMSLPILLIFRLTWISLK